MQVKDDKNGPSNRKLQEDEVSHPSSQVDFDSDMFDAEITGGQEDDQDLANVEAPSESKDKEKSVGKSPLNYTHKIGNLDRKIGN